MAYRNSTPGSAVIRSRSHPAGAPYGRAFDDVVAGYVAGEGLDAAASQMTVEINPTTAMMFKIEEINIPWGRVRVHPVAAIGPAVALLTSPDAGPDATWLRSGPSVSLRLEMRLYRWCLSFGEFVLNYEDLHTGHLATAGPTSSTG